MSEEIKLIFDLHRHQLESYPKDDSLMSKIDGKWQGYSTREFLDTANQMSLGLLSLGIQPGDKVAMVSNNRPEWHITDLAIMQIGAINVPIYPNITEDDYSYILTNCEAKLVFTSDKELYQKMCNVKSNCPDLTDIYSFEKIESAKFWTDLFVDSADISSIIEIKKTIKEDDLATLIYTSGTTGKPKGVMISHRNLVSNVLASTERLPCDENGRSLSFLPLCHVYERMVCYLYIFKGVSIYYAESLETIGDNLREIKPQVFTAVPRLLEKIYDKILAKASELSGIKKALFFWALNLGLKYDIHGKSTLYKMQLALANKIIFSKWREALGGNALAIASGSAALQPRLARVFLAAQIPVMEGYGLTETAVVVSVSCYANDGVRIGKVGRPLYNVTVKIAEDGEILVKGPNVMMGYYKNEEATKEVIDNDGWFHTGDIGEIDEEGFLKITDRKKEIFKTSGGKYIAPQVMENKLKESHFIEQLMVIGEFQKHPAALIQPAFDFLKDYCKRKGINYVSNEEIIKNPEIVNRFDEEIKKFNTSLAQYERIKKFRLTPSAWSIEGGEVTPTLKLRRKIILEKYKALVDDIYGGDQE